MSAMIGEYDSAEIAAMTPDEFTAAKERGFKREGERSAAAGVSLGSSVPVPDEQRPEPSRTAWKDAKAQTERDFTVPSGQICRLRKLTPESLMAEGILDKVTRLEGLAQIVVDRAQGLPPKQRQMPTREEFGELLDLVNRVVPLAVSEPVVYGDDDDAASADSIRVSDIDLMDRVAILNESLKGLKAFDNFRPAG